MEIVTMESYWLINQWGFGNQKRSATRELQLERRNTK
jgi:hypothetical protein